MRQGFITIIHNIIHVYRNTFPACQATAANHVLAHKCRCVLFDTLRSRAYRPTEYLLKLSGCSVECFSLPFSSDSEPLLWSFSIDRVPSSVDFIVSSTIKCNIQLLDLQTILDLGELRLRCLMLSRFYTLSSLSSRFFSVVAGLGVLLSNFLRCAI